MMAKGQQQTGIMMESVGMQMGGLGGFDSAPLSFGAPPMSAMKPTIQVLPNADDNMDVMDFAEFKQEPAFFVPSKCAAPSGLQPTPAFYNRMTSIVVDESPKQVLDKMANILSGYTNDIDFVVNETAFNICGTVFVRNLAVIFKISVWDHGSNRTLFECRRTKGDTVAFTEFWNNMEQELYRQFGNPTGFGQDGDEEEEEDDMGLQFGALPPLDYNLTLDLGDLEEDNQDDNEPTGLTPKHLGDFVDDMKHSDPSVVYSIAMLIDALQASTAAMMVENAAFLQCVIQSALTHQDTALVRGALVMLEKLCEDCESGADTLMGYKVLNYVIPLLNHEVQLIRKYAVRLLGKLCAAKSWTLENQKLRQFAKISVNKCRTKWQDAQFATNDFIETKMFDDINNKLISVK